MYNSYWMDAQLTSTSKTLQELIDLDKTLKMRTTVSTSNGYTYNTADGLIYIKSKTVEDRYREQTIDETDLNPENSCLGS